MAPTLMEYLAGKKCEVFIASPHYFQDGDFVTYFYRDDLAYEERIDELLTVYRSIDTQEMVGCKIKGVRRILQELGNFGVFIDDGQMLLGMLFMAAAMVNPEKRQDYERVSRTYGNVRVDPKEFQTANAA